MPESSLILQLLWQSAVVPLAVALAILAAGRALRLDAVGAVLAVALAFIASYFATLHAQWSALPRLALDWLPWIAAGAAVAALAAESVANAAARFAARLATGVVAAALVAWGAVGSLGIGMTVLATGVAGLAIAAVWSALTPAAKGGVRRPMFKAVVAGGTGLALMLDSSQSLGQLSGALAMALAACMLFNLPRTRMAFPPAARGVAVVILGVLIANAWLYAGFSLVYVALLLGALLADPVLAVVARLRRGHADPHSWIPAAVLTTIPVLVTVAMVLKAAQEHGGY